ncbi:hypothetical protein SPHINGO8BC_140156 [Sphingobacterium multivorum]|uniref:Uncharacterized protein n=1 Tax=Sphingobacterium multivorum TaxID=28454 RepID=A0A653ZI24_SPHMU|nr:hypothetical protein SPHINGO8BC_140156 [Sphingobacterium multivorum]
MKDEEVVTVTLRAPLFSDGTVLSSSFEHPTKAKVSKASTTAYINFILIFIT